MTITLSYSAFAVIVTGIIRTATCGGTGNLQHLHGFRQDQKAVHTFLHHIPYHAVPREQFLQYLQGTLAAVTDVVVAEITEGQRCLTGCQLRRAYPRIRSGSPFWREGCHR